MDGVVAVVGFFFLIVGVLVAFRLFLGTMDHSRVEEYIEARGGRVIDKQWNPFGPGWFGSQHERIYDVRYEDRDGNLHDANCKTSLLAGVYFTEDRVVASAEELRSGRAGRPLTTDAGEDNDTDLAAHRASLLAEENHRLRAEIERLKRGDS
jgi:hypothetical protein